ncbi:MAG: T9SS type A sorting domain-containing protein [Bacteroidales bacterium]|nr:T9SS type A sorting domain-containing protein [Bacteroidales bacterium]MCF6341852.1 T9SS type A sorting domain-containing protein [Bacteroidales bacterium]
MKLFYKIFLVILIPGFLVFYSFSSGSPGGKTGSPGDDANCTDCHEGVPQNVAGWITSNIPEEGYKPGDGYTIIAHGTHSGVVKFGFELTAENQIGIKKGEFFIVDNARTQKTGTGKSVTHTQDGTDPDGDEASWSMKWIAPEAGTGQVRFYAAFNAANGNGNNGGDVIYLSMLSVEEQLVSSVVENSLANQVSIFPNPATDVVNLSLPEGAELQLVDLLGKVLLGRKSVAAKEKLNISRFEKGIYFVRVTHHGETYTVRLLKN